MSVITHLSPKLDIWDTPVRILDVHEKHTGKSQTTLLMACTAVFESFHPISRFVARPAGCR
jgi:hypothetical protein